MNKEVFEFLKELKLNNNREWFAENKEWFERCKQSLQINFNSIYSELEKKDALEPQKVYRIYRDIRFSKDKTPYKTHFSMYAGRLKPLNRGGYYLHIEPGNSFVGGGFWGPNNEDLLRIRQEIAIDNDLVEIINNPDFKSYYGELEGESLKTAPKGFDKNHERIELLRKKQYLFRKMISDKEVLSNQFNEIVVDGFLRLLPFFEYMTDVLLTNANGERKFE